VEVGESYLLREPEVYVGLAVRVFPIVRRELAVWRSRAGKIPDDELRKQALSSISSKAFHCMGGSVLALENPDRLGELVRAIVAIQTVSDYLDNLCDRAAFARPWANDPTIDAAREGFLSCMSLHETFRCAVDPTRPVTPFYRLYKVAHPGGDGGYLDGLVQASRDVLGRFDAYRQALPWVNYLAGLYSELQSIKHLSPAIRNGLMEEWYRARWLGDLDPEECALPLSQRVLDGHMDDPLACGGDVPLAWWEFAAATGSTLGIFALVSASSRLTSSLPWGSGHDDATSGHRRVPVSPTRHQSGGSSLFDRLAQAYFPTIAGLHILLDYYIDREEDRLGGDLNFVSFYPSPDAREAAMGQFVGRALDQSRRLPNPWLHTAVVRGLLSMYLSDPKARAAGMRGAASALASRGGPLVRVLLPACRVTRRLLDF
jgi:tetraprenyl-beta-curcumene synthase